MKIANLPFKLPPCDRGIKKGEIMIFQSKSGVGKSLIDPADFQVIR